MTVKNAYFLIESNIPYPHLRSVLLYIETEALVTCFGRKALESFFQHHSLRSTTLIESDRELQFGNTFIESKCSAEFILPRYETFSDISVLLDFADIIMKALVGIHTLDSYRISFKISTPHI